VFAEGLRDADPAESGTDPPPLHPGRKAPGV